MSVGVLAGSSTQIGVLVMPFCVILAWCFGQPLDLNFNGGGPTQSGKQAETSSTGTHPRMQKLLPQQG
jgi:hypothetical protein